MITRTRKAQPICAECGADRVRRWEEARAANGLTEEEWPRPTAPVFADEATLRAHQARVHGVRP